MEDQNLDLPNILQDLPDQVVDSSTVEEESMAEEVANVNTDNVISSKWLFDHLDYAQEVTG